jgi:hypothetical protein
MLGWEIKELISKPGHDNIHHTKPDGSPYPIKECPIYAAFNDGVIRYEDNVFWRKDGSHFPQVLLFRKMESLWERCWFLEISQNVN